MKTELLFLVNFNLLAVDLHHLSCRDHWFWGKSSVWVTTIHLVCLTVSSNDDEAGEDVVSKVNELDFLFFVGVEEGALVEEDVQQGRGRGGSATWLLTLASPGTMLDGAED